MSHKKKKEETTPVGDEMTTEEATTAPEEAPVEEKTPSQDDILAAARDESKKNWDLYLRERADLENFRKRAQREKEDLARFANENILRELLPVLDNLDRALSHARESESDAGALLEGVEMTHNQLKRVLEKFGAVPFDSIGTPFDPSRHEAMGQMESAEHPPNTVVQEMQKGYLLNDRLLRPALVMIGKAPADATPKDA